MSIILDALKKADAERHLGQLPGLHTTASAAVPAPDTGRRSWQRPLLAAGVVVALVGISAAIAVMSGWRPLQQPAGVVLVAKNAGESALPATGASTGIAGPASSSAAHGAAPTVAMAPAPSVATEVPAPAPLPVSPKPAPRQALVSSTAAVSPAAMPAAPKSAPAAAPSAPGNGAKPATTASAASNPALAERTERPTAKPAAIDALSLAQLPPALRSELPAMAIGGSMYSANPADRMLLIDKRMLHEGDEIAPGLLLEAIQQKSAILRYKGVVFRLPF